MYGTAKNDGYEFWSTEWKEGRAIWQLPGVMKALSDNKDVIMAGKRDAQVFIPLCGKAHELKWFLEMGHRVVGVEFVEQCAREYFLENGFDMEEITCPVTGCKIFQTPDRRLRIFTCSIFDFKRECAGPMDIVFDRSGFTAIPEPDRAKYAAVVKPLLAPGFSYAMWTVVYDAPWYKTSPRSTDEATLREHFGDAGKLELVASRVMNPAVFLDGVAPATITLWRLSG